MRLPLFASAVAAASLVGCGDLPQPFRHEGAPPELARPTSGRAVTVEPVDDSPGGRAMAEALVKALSAREIPAAIGRGTPSALRLHGKAEAADGAVRLAWELDGPDHSPQSTARQVVPEVTWRQAQPEAFAPLAVQAVAALTADVPAPPPPRPTRRPTVRLLAPAGVPGDGGPALARAMKNALEREGILVVGEGGDYMLEAKVTVTPGPAGQEVLAVAWTVRRPDGKELGTIGQKGAVPAGRLLQPWGGLARDIAAGGADGVAQVVEAAGRGP